MYTLADWVNAQVALGTATAMLGGQPPSDDTSTEDSRVNLLQTSTEAYDTALANISDESEHFAFLQVQIMKGNALVQLGARMADLEWTDDAKEQLHSALATLDASVGGAGGFDPALWAIAQNGRGKALERLGLLDEEPSELRDAQSAYNAALQALTSNNETTSNGPAVGRRGLLDLRRFLPTLDLLKGVQENLQRVSEELVPLSTLEKSASHTRGQ